MRHPTSPPRSTGSPRRRWLWLTMFALGLVGTVGAIQAYGALRSWVRLDELDERAVDFVLRWDEDAEPYRSVLDRLKDVRRRIEAHRGRIGSLSVSQAYEVSPAESRGIHWSPRAKRIMATQQELHQEERKVVTEFRRVARDRRDHVVFAMWPFPFHPNVVAARQLESHIQAAKQKLGPRPTVLLLAAGASLALLLTGALACVAIWRRSGTAIPARLLGDANA